MSNIPEDLRYTKSHEWVKVEDDGTLVIGITDHAQDQLGDMVFVEVHEAGKSVDSEGECAVIESVKAASEVYAPVAGEILAGNDALTDAPEKVNKDPYGDGWLLKLKAKSADDVTALMDASAYSAFLESEDH